MRSRPTSSSTPRTLPVERGRDLVSGRERRGPERERA